MSIWSSLKHWVNGYTTIPKNVVFPQVFVGDMESILMYYRRKDYTPDMITPEFMENNPNAVFVFGSNVEGRHGAGAALLAKDLGCPLGFGEGYHAESQTYAIPTLDFRKKGNTRVTIGELAESIRSLFVVAKANPDKVFYLTQIGTGLGGWQRADVMDAIWAGAL